MTEFEKEVLDWQTFEGGEAWYSNAIKVFGQEQADVFLAAKIERYKDQYLNADDKRPRIIREPITDYKQG